MQRPSFETICCIASPIIRCNNLNCNNDHYEAKNSIASAIDMWQYPCYIDKFFVAIAMIATEIVPLQNGVVTTEIL
jgi:hypothetical protein